MVRVRHARRRNERVGEALERLLGAVAHVGLVLVRALVGLDWMLDWGVGVMMGGGAVCEVWSSVTSMGVRGV